MNLDEKTVSDAMKNIPDVEVNNVKKMSPADNISDQQIRWMIACNRLMNPCCRFCRQKEEIHQLRLCDCKLVWYCSHRDCKYQDSRIHKRWCCKKRAKDIDRGPMMTGTIRIKQ